MNCDLMDGRDAFLTLARDKHYEFSSLRRAQFSTLSMLYELHNQGNDKFVYTCNHCKNHVETRYHCTICDVSFSNISDSTHRRSISKHHKEQIKLIIHFVCPFFAPRRISICVLAAKRRWATNTKWRSWASIWTTVRQRI